MAEPVSPGHLRRERFLAAFARTLNTRRAMHEAGDSDSYCRSSGAKLLREPQIAKRVEQIRRRYLGQQERTVTKDRVLAELATVAFSNVQALYGSDGKLRAVKDLDAEVAAAVQSVRVGRSGTHFQVCDKLKSLELLGKSLNLFSEPPGSGVVIVVNTAAPAALDPALTAGSLSAEQPSSVSAPTIALPLNKP